MCRLLGYLGPPVFLETLLLQPEHSLVVQSYQPQEMTSGLLNADGFGVGWYHPAQAIAPGIYRNTLPIWNDPNLKDLSRYIESGCVLANVRSATAGQAVQLSNCQPFVSGQILGIHNGLIENFRQTLYRPLRQSLSDARYQAIEGTTDSEHIFALICDAYAPPEVSLAAALQIALAKLIAWAEEFKISLGLNLILSDGNSLVAARCAFPHAPPSLYWLRNHPPEAGGVLVASEPIFASDQWMSCAANSIVVIGENLDIQTYPVSGRSPSNGNRVRSPQNPAPASLDRLP